MSIILSRVVPERADPTMKNIPGVLKSSSSFVVRRRKVCQCSWSVSGRTLPTSSAYFGAAPTSDSWTWSEKRRCEQRSLVQRATLERGCLIAPTPICEFATVPYWEGRIPAPMSSTTEAKRAPGERPQVPEGTLPSAECSAHPCVSRNCADPAGPVRMDLYRQPRPRRAHQGPCLLHVAHRADHHGDPRDLLGHQGSLRLLQLRVSCDRTRHGRVDARRFRECPSFTPRFSSWFCFRS